MSLLLVFTFGVAHLHVVLCVGGMRNNVEGPCNAHCLPPPERPPPAKLHDQDLSCCLTLENDGSQHYMCTAL